MTILTTKSISLHRNLINSYPVGVCAAAAAAAALKAGCEGQAAALGSSPA